MDRIAIAAEKLRRAKRAEFTAKNVLFDLQQNFVNDRSRLIANCSARRAGKSYAEAYALLDRAMERPSVNAVYSALTFAQARRNLWQTLLTLNERYSLGGEPHGTRLTLTMPNQSVIHLTGMDERNMADKWRGIPNLVLVILDEAQSYRDEVLQYALYEVFKVAQLDKSNSQIIISGSPGPLPVGYFHDVIHASTTPWSRHGWDIFCNPKLEGDPKQVIQEECEEKGITESAPYIQRAFFNRWVQDSESLVYPYDEAVNDFDPTDPLPPDCVYTLGVDVGFRDADALVVAASKGRHVWIVEQVCHRGQLTDQLVAQIKELVQRYQPIDCVIDPAAGGVRVAADLAAIHGIQMRAADRQDRIAAINLYADALRSGRIHIPKDSRLVAEYRAIEWEPGARGVRESKIGPHYDLPDAALYAWRSASKYFTADEVTIGPSRALTLSERWEVRDRESDEREEERLENPEENDWCFQDWQKD